MKTKRSETHMIVYCGDGTIDDPSSDEDQRQIDAVCTILGQELSIMFASLWLRRL